MGNVKKTVFELGSLGGGAANKWLCL